MKYILMLVFSASVGGCNSPQLAPPHHGHVETASADVANVSAFANVLSVIIHPRQAIPGPNTELAKMKVASLRDKFRLKSPLGLRFRYIDNNRDEIWEWKTGNVRVLPFDSSYDALLRIDRASDGRMLVSFDTSVFEIHAGRVKYVGPMIN